MAERRRSWSPSLHAGMGMMALLLLVAVLAPIFLSSQAETLSPDISAGPSAAHWLGTDQLGRDVLARSLVATRLTLVMSATATAIAAVAGLLIGGLIWLASRRLRTAVLWIIASTVAFPSLILALVIAAVLGPGTVSAVVAIGVAGIPSFARIVSNITAPVVRRDFVLTARSLGVPHLLVFTRHILPNISGPLLVLSASSFALALLEISSLSFVGLGVQSPDFDFGRLLNEALPALYSQPLQVVAPSFMLIYAGVAAMLIGDGIAVTIDPRLSLGRRRASTITRTPSTAPASPDPEVLLEARGLTISTNDEKVIVDAVDLQVRRGEIVGIVGESGSGKSTTAMAVAGLLHDSLHISADEMTFDGMDLLGKFSRRRLASDLGLVYQEPATTLNPALRVGAQLTEVARLHLGMTRRAAQHKLVANLRQFRVRNPEQVAHQHPFTLSGGMTQRAIIASSLLSTPKLIIADEPTTALDVTVQLEVLREFRRVNVHENVALLFISHDLAVVAALCDRVVVMKDGRIVDELVATQLHNGTAIHPYTRMLLDTAPRVTIEQES